MLSAWTFGTIRTVYFVKLLSSDDVVYQMSGVAIWTIWEVTTGFLIMGIPAFPRAAKSLPMSDSIASFFHLLSGHSRTDGPRPGVPQWRLYRPKPRRPRGPWDISELETRDLVSTRSAENESDDNKMNDPRVEMVANEGASRNEMQIV